MNAKLLHFLRQHAVGQHFLDFKPGRASLYDGNEHRLPGKIVALIKLWRGNPRLHHESLESYAAYQGGDVLDVGAFHGWYSWLLAPKANPGEVFVSCEPDPRAFRHLLRNLATVGSVFPALSASALPQPIGSGAPLAIHHPGGGHPQFRSDSAAEGTRQTVRLDDLSAALHLRPSFVKIDVEGAELGVLLGMERILDELHPTLMLEIHPKWQPPGVTVDDVQAVLLKHGYRGGEADVSAVAVRQVWK